MYISGERVVYTLTAEYLEIGHSLYYLVLTFFSWEMYTAVRGS